MGRASQVPLVVKNPPATEGDTGDVCLIPGSGSSPGGGHGNLQQHCCLENPMAPMGNGTPLQYSCLENPMDGGAWKAAVHGVAEGRTRLSDFTFTFHFPALEKEMATHSTVLAWRIPGTAEPWWATVYGVAQSRIRLKRLSSSSSSSMQLFMDL